MLHRILCNLKHTFVMSLALTILHRGMYRLNHTFVMSLAFPLHATQESVRPKAHLCDVSCFSSACYTGVRAA